MNFLCVGESEMNRKPVCWGVSVACRGEGLFHLALLSGLKRLASRSVLTHRKDSTARSTLLQLLVSTAHRSGCKVNVQ